MKVNNYKCRSCGEVFLTVEAQYEEEYPIASGEWIGKMEREHQNRECSTIYDEDVFYYTDGEIAE